MVMPMTGPPHLYLADVKGSCPACDAMGLISFRWPPEEAKDPSSSWANARDIASQLEFVRALKFGDLYRCGVCDRWWYLDPDSPMMERVPTPRRELLDAWDAKRLSPSGSDLGVMREIGATCSDLYGNERGDWNVPCKIRWADGDISDPCVLIVSKRPPINDWQRRLALFEDIASLEPSKYALPREVRLASYNAPEISMGFTPTHVKSSGGAIFILNGYNDVFWYDGVKGCDISLEPSRFEYSPSIPIVHTPIEAISFVYCHWFPECVDLAILG